MATKFEREVAVCGREGRDEPVRGKLESGESGKPGVVGPRKGVSGADGGAEN